MRDDNLLVSDISVMATGAIFIVGLVVLGFRLAQVQLVDSAKYMEDGSRQSVRRVQTAGPRGRIIAGDGTILANNRASVSIVLNPEAFQRKSWKSTIAAVSNAVDETALVLGLSSSLSERDIARHIRQQLAMPLVVWRDVDEKAIARFVEHERDFPGFECIETEERVYPERSLAAHVLGYVGRGETESAGPERFNFRDIEMKGRAGLELFYDGYLRGSPGEVQLTVDARGFAVAEETVAEARRGPDLVLTIDPGIQRVVERQLRGLSAACVVMDPRDGAVLALASTPAYDLNELVPRLSREMFSRYVGNHQYRNRACFETYAPGSTFKPITALAALSSGIDPMRTYECIGVFELGGMRLHCARRWGHGLIDMRHALKDSCNPYFCDVATKIGTNALFSAARAFGLGSRTGIDFPQDSEGVVPSADYKRRNYGAGWFTGDLAQAAIGQGQFLVTPLQMVRVAGAVGTGCLVRPHLRADAPAERTKLPFKKSELDVVRDGMRMVVTDGSGRRGCANVAVDVCGKTGTAEVGRGATRRKNTWFIAYAPASDPTVAIAMVIENGDSGGGTTAPRVGEVLRSIFGTAQ